MIMKLSEFCQEYEVKTNTVSMYLKEHAEEFKGHTWTEGKARILDEEAIALLSKHYKKPGPKVEIVTNEMNQDIIRLQDELLEARNQIIEYQHKIVELVQAQSLERENMLKQLSDYQNQQILALEDKEKISSESESKSELIAEMTDKIKVLEQQVNENNEITKLQEELKQYEEKYNAERSKKRIDIDYLCKLNDIIRKLQKKLDVLRCKVER